MVFRSIHLHDSVIAKWKSLQAMIILQFHSVRLASGRFVLACFTTVLEISLLFEK